MEQALQEFFGGPLGAAVLTFAGVLIAAIAAVTGAVVAAILALGGVVVGGMLEGRRQREAAERKQRWERVQLRNQKLEELADGCTRVYRKFSVLAQAADEARETGLDQALNEFANQLEVVERDHFALGEGELSRIEVLVGFYAPELAHIAEMIRSSQSGSLRLLEERWRWKDLDASEARWTG